MAQNEFRLIKKLDFSELKNRNVSKCWDIFNYHLLRNGKYAMHVGAKKISNWGDIPILKKSDLQHPLAERLSDGANKNRVHIHNTSGSSGTPFHFAKDKFCHAMCWAVIDDRFSWHGIEVGKSLQARFYGIPLAGKAYWKERIKDMLASRVRFPVFDLSDEKLDAYLKSFVKHPFIYINGYTSSLVLFAKHILAQGFVLKQICPSLEVVITTSEVCDEMDRSIMEMAFGVKVVNEYGAAELDLIAFEDMDGDWLLNHETLFVEILDDDGRPATFGQEGRVVITSLYNKAMPFIRYELGDRAIMSARTKGPYGILEKVSGRVNDVAILPSGKRSPGLTFYYISKALLESGGIIKEFIIKQTSLNEFVFEYVAERKLSLNEEMEVKKAMDTYLEPGLNASFVRTDIIKRTNAGKLKHFTSELVKSK